MTDTIKTMQLYPRADRIYVELAALGYGPDVSVPVEVLNRFDQLHYHGTDALDVAVKATGMGSGQAVLEVGSGWGGCARYLAQKSGAHLTAVELQEDYDRIARDLTRRAGLARAVSHVNADFLTLDLPDEGFDHCVSWLALFHIPDRPRYLAKLFQALRPGGMIFVEDLYLKAPPPQAQAEDFARHLFPNSLVPWDAYQSGLARAGFEAVQPEDMTEDWTIFTATRLAAFETARAAYEARHGAEGYRVIHGFYEKMAGYFRDGFVGGVRLAARKPLS